MRRILFIIPILAGVIAFAGDESPKHLIEQKDKSFSVTEITVKPGEVLVFKNSDEVTHNVFSTSKANAFNIKVQQPGGSSEVAFSEEGTTEVRCAIHPKMKLLVTVKK